MDFTTPGFYLIQKHMQNVFACLGLSAVAAGVGGFAYFFVNFVNSSAFLMAPVGLVLNLLSLVVTPIDGRNEGERLSFLLMFAFNSGLLLGQFVEAFFSDAISIVIPCATILTVSVLTSFFQCSLFMSQNVHIYVVETLMFCCTVYLAWSILNDRPGPSLYKIMIVGVFALISTWIMCRTQEIMKRLARGDKDYVWHAFLLFLDLTMFFLPICWCILPTIERIEMSLTV